MGAGVLCFVGVNVVRWCRFVRSDPSAWRAIGDASRHFSVCSLSTFREMLRYVGEETNNGETETQTNRF